MLNRYWQHAVSIGEESGKAGRKVNETAMRIVQPRAERDWRGRKPLLDRDSNEMKRNITSAAAMASHFA